MTRFVITEGLGISADLSEVDFSILGEGAVTAHSSTSVTFTDDEGDSLRLTGTGFGSFTSGGVPRQGTVTGLQILIGGVAVVVMSEANVSVATFIALAVSGDEAGLQNLLFGSADVMYGAEENDVLMGFGGNDQLYGGGGADTLNGGVGIDTMVGGGASDKYYVDNVKDVVTELAGQGADLVYSSVTYTLSANVENLILTGAATISGAGNSGNNLIVGNTATNRLAGRGGADVFDFNATAQSSAKAFDTIIDLSNDDRIDLSTIDANVNRSGNQGFTMVDKFTKTAGQMTMKFYEDLGITSILMDVNGDGKADMKIVLTGDHHDFTNFAF